MTDTNESSTPIFRSITVQTTGGKPVEITLGQPLSAEAMALCVPAGPNKFQLKPGTYAGAEKIVIQVGLGAAVQEMYFAYLKGTDYKELYENFVGELGPPDSQSGDEARQESVWKDDSTEFELKNSPSGITSTLTNLAPTAS